jgi:cytochrome P450/CRP-like cAMP-binding protein
LPRTFIRAYRAHGSAFRLQAPGHAFTVLAGPEANLFLGRGSEAILSNARAYHRVARDHRSDHYLQAMDGAAHDRLRRQLQPGFSREAICGYIPRIAQAIHLSARDWSPGQRLNVRDTAMQLATEATTMALANSRVGDRFDGLRRYIETLIGAGIAIWPPVLLQLPGHTAARSQVEQFLDEVLAAHRAQPPGDDRPANLVDLVLALRDGNGQPLSPADQRACLQVVPANSAMYVGRALGFLLYDLLKHPTALERVQREVDSLLDRGLPDAALLRQMPALRGAVLESLRLHPSAIVLPRIATRPFEFAGYRVDAGTRVLMGTTLAHFDPAIFPNPDLFDIDRYAEPRSEHRQPGVYAPFGAGAHTCLSLGLVETLLMLSVAALLRTVELALDPPDYALKTVTQPVPGPEAGFHLRVVAQRDVAMPTEVVRPGRMTPAELAGVLPALSAAQLIRVNARLKPRAYAAGTAIVREGEAADSFYILLEGEVAVVKRGLDGESREVARLQAGAYFGEIGLLQGVPRTATVQALTAVRALVLDRDTFMEMVVDSDLTSAEIAQMVRQRHISTSLALALPTLAPELIQSLADSIELMRYASGETLIQQGERSETFFVIARGRVQVTNHHPSGHDIVLAERGPGEYFGETGLLQGAPRTATVKALSEVEVLVLGRPAFRALIGESPLSGEAITRRMVERLLETQALTANADAKPRALAEDTAPV